MTATCNVRQFDAGDPDQVERLIDSIEALDVLINNGAMVLYRGQEFDMEGFRRMMEVNHRGHCATGSVRSLRNNAAASSMWRRWRHTALCKTRLRCLKAGVVSLTKTLAVAFAKDNPRNGLAPGYVETNITEVSHTNDAISDAIVQGTPMRRWVSRSIWLGRRCSWLRMT